jgi:subtilase family serine protease
MKSGWRIIPILVISVACAAWAAPDRIAGTIDNSQTVLLKSNVHPKALPEYDQGPVEPSTELGRITMMFQASTSQQADLKKLLAQQQDPASPNYHKWLSPEQYAERFGLSQGDINKISEWLRSQGFSIVEVARGQERIAFSGTAEMVQNAFHTAIHRYNVDGEMHIANATAPSIPSGLAGVVTGFLGLNDFGPKPMGLRKPAQGSALLPNIIMHPYYDGGGGNNFLGPDDLATIYDINALYTAGINGTGMKMVIVGQTDLNMSGGKAIDIDNFRAGFSLPVSEPTQILPTGCTDPIGVISGDVGESDLDLEWAGAVARNATIDFVKCKQSQGGVFESAF